MEILSKTNVHHTRIQKFYKNENILITGGTGFLGKMLIEKLLRSCNDINAIYLLIRAKKGKNMHCRVEELFDDPVFEKLREEHPKFRHKVQGIAGDCSLPGLGLNDSDRQLLASEVSVVFHAAATVKFDEKLRMATAINVVGPKDMFLLSRDMKNLKSVVHVSTAYSHCTRKFIGEKFYSTPISANKLISLVDSSEDKLLENVTPKVLQAWPNTYTYTKAIAEDYVRTDCIDMPIGIFRPAIVVSTYREPIEGWVDNMYGPTGICAGAGTGVLRSLPCQPKANANVVPVDMCVNALICTAWQVHKDHQNLLQEKKEKTESDIPIYNYVSCEEKSINWEEFMALSEKYGIYYPSSRAIWYYSFTFNRHYIIHLLYVLFLQLIPGLLVDSILLCLGKQPQLLKMYKKVLKFTGIINYFTIRNWDFSNYNVKKLLHELEPNDRQIFQFDMSEIDWENYFKNYMKGIRIYLLKEPLKNLAEAQKRWRKLYWLHQTTKIIFAVLAFKLLWSFMSYLI